jgi:osmotically-inducible protein OsmY
MTTHNHTKSDAEIQQDVLHELAWDTRVAPSDVGVDVHSGVVTLTGTVPSWAKKIAAEEAAHRVSCVLDVANDMTVKVTGTGLPTDTEIATAVRNALKWDVFVPDEKIQSTVTTGDITLKGRVETNSQREDAERAVRNLAGVRIVFNEITVEAAEVKPDNLRKAIHDALERHAEREADRLQIDIEGGCVTLHGSVESWREREAVIGAVTGTRGVANVIDRIRIAS